MFEYLELPIDSAINSGAKYTDAGILISKSRNIAPKNGEVENYNESEKNMYRNEGVSGVHLGVFTPLMIFSKPSLPNGRAYSLFKMAKPSSMGFWVKDLPFCQRNR
jgi:hypothetical protein